MPRPAPTSRIPSVDPEANRPSIRAPAGMAAGYRVEIVYVRIDSPQLALKRIAARVKQGGHDMPREDVLRRFARSWANFDRVYRPCSTDRWPTRGRCTIIQAPNPGCRKNIHDGEGKAPTDWPQRSRPRGAARPAARARDRPHARHADLRDEGRQGRRAEALSAAARQFGVRRARPSACRRALPDRQAGSRCRTKHALPPRRRSRAGSARLHLPRT
jgi:hypothetical protein